MIEMLFYAILFILIFDGIKMFAESFMKRRIKSYIHDNREVTAIIATHNEEDIILDTIKSVSHSIPEENIIIVDDASTDATVRKVTLSTFKGKIFPLEKLGKVGAIHWVLKFVKTKYVLLLDADVNFGKHFRLPASLLESGHSTAVAFNVVPEMNAKTGWERFIIMLQRHEYAKSMHIGKRFQNETKSVHNISGAAGLFHTDRLKKLALKHTGIFPGEDLERTLLELSAEGKVSFCDEIIYTDVPRSLYRLSKQRIVGWWPGLWRNLWLFIKLTLKKSSPFRLRYEMIYETVSILLDPLKIYSLYLLIVSSNWYALYVIYAVYFLLEWMVYYRVNKIDPKYIDYQALVVISYPLYSALQMVYRLLAFFVFIYKWTFSSEWHSSPRRKQMAMLTVFLLMFSVSAVSQDWTVGGGYHRISDNVNLRAYDHYNLYLGYQNYYIEGNHGAFNQINVGTYQKYFQIDLRVRDADIMPKVIGEYWFGNVVTRALYGHVWITKDNEYSQSNFSVVGVGSSLYFGDSTWNYIALDVIKEYGRVYGLTFIAKERIGSPYGIWNTTGVSINTFGDKGAFAQIGYKMLYLDAQYYQNYDYNSFDRIFIGVGVILTF